MWLRDVDPCSAICLEPAYYAERLTCNVQWAVNEVIALFLYNFCFFHKSAKNTFFKFVQSLANITVLLFSDSNLFFWAVKLLTSYITTYQGSLAL
jgi:hypothetical protein